MNQLPLAKRVQVLSSLVEGMGIRATARTTDVAVNTVIKLLIDAGKACIHYHDNTIRNIKAKRVECDEQWGFCYVKQKNVPPDYEGIFGYGDVWTWLAIDAETKLIISWLVGLRTSEYAEIFISDLASRLANRIQLTTDGYSAYIKAIEKVFGGLIDYAMLVKNYNERAHYIGADKRIICGNPELEYISTSYVERLNLTMRMQNRRFTRKTNAFSKKIDNLNYSVALTTMFYNFVHIHSTLRVTPAMEAGVANTLWSVEDLIRLIPTPIIGRRGPYKKQRDKIISN
jgi:IS1 family transposase